MRLTGEANSGRISKQMMEALTLLFHKEECEMAAACGQPCNDSPPRALRPFLYRVSARIPCHQDRV